MKIKTLLLFILLTTITGCELIPLAKTNEKSSGYYNYHQYYLSLKTMPAKAIKAEVNSLKNTDATHLNITNKLKLALVYCLPNSPIYNPYNAKDILNKLELNNKQFQKQFQFSSENLAFLMLLKDALNQQLLTFEKHNQQITKQNQEMDKLKAELISLKAKITQLKSIENKLNERE